jgi:hypothetical protein
MRQVLYRHYCSRILLVYLLGVLYKHKGKRALGNYMQWCSGGTDIGELHHVKKTSFWVNYNNSLIGIKAIWGWFPLLTMIPVRSQSEIGVLYQDHWNNKRGICSSKQAWINLLCNRIETTNMNICPPNMEWVYELQTWRT